MKKLIFVALLLIMAGCATVTPPASPSDGIIHQDREFKDLSVQDQQTIMEGGGGGE